MPDPSVAGLKFIWDMIVGLIKGYEAEKSKLFENHVEPLHQKLLLIHMDYIAGFQELKRHLQDKSKPLPEVVEFLEERRRNKAALRGLAGNITKELEAAERRLVRADAWDEIKAFTTAIAEYLDASVRFTGSTWFSGYLDLVKQKIKLGAENPWFDISIHGEPKGDRARQDLINMITPILDRDLPSALVQVNASYAKLKTLLQ